MAVLSVDAVGTVAAGMARGGYSMDIFDAVRENVRPGSLFEALTGSQYKVVGDEGRASCPLPAHPDKNPSFSMNLTTGQWDCKGCGESGDIVHLVEKYKGYTPAESAKWICEEQNIYYDDNIDKEDSQRLYQERLDRQEVMVRYIDYCHDNIGDEHWDMLRGRGLSDTMIDQMRFGYDPGKIKNNKENAAKIGLLSHNGNYISRRRIIIPVHERGDPVYWIAWDPNSERKYLYPRGLKRPLWGLDQLRPGVVWLVEGVFDYLSLLQAKMPVLGALGTSISRYVERLKKVNGLELRIAFDNDKKDSGANPGLEAAVKVATLLWPDVRAEIVMLPPGKDPNDIFVDSDDFCVRMEIFERKTVIDYLMEKIESAPDKEKIIATNPVLSLIARLENKLESDHYLRLVQQAWGGQKKVNLTALREQLAVIRKEGPPAEDDGEVNPGMYFGVTANGSERFMPPLLGKHILEDDHYLFVGGDLKRYKNGVFQSESGSVLNKKIQDKLQDRWEKGHWNQVQTWIEQRTHVNTKDLPKNEGLINVKNGMLDIVGGKLLSHSPSYKSIIQHPVVFDPEAKSPLLEEFVKKIVPEGCDLLVWEFAGYCLLRTLELKKTMFFTGGGWNGKSRLIEVVFEKPLGGEYISHESLQDLSENRFSTAQVFGKVANIYDDLSKAAVQETGAFKMLTGGSTIRGERKNQTPFYFQNMAKLLFTANDLPAVHDYNDAFFDRLMIVDCPYVFGTPEDVEKGNADYVADPEIAESLTTEEAMSAWLNLAIDGARRILSQGHFTPIGRVEENVDQYRVEADSVTAFIRECLLPLSGSTVDKKDVYEAYRNWCKESGAYPVKETNFGRRAKNEPNKLEDTKVRKDGFRPLVWLNCRFTDIAEKRYLNTSYY